ncbi:MAG: ATP-binding protein [Deltaproteobacteria bacterium]|nr:ATP-binding protein [Deltaproteobacteria bacterium]
MRTIDIPSYITRPIYVERMNPLVGMDVIKVLVGQRRVGKSYLLYHVVDMIKERDPACPILYINKELTAFDDIRTHADLLDVAGRQLGSSGRGCILIDEVQEIDNWPRALRSLAAEKRFDIYCTGSNAEMLSGDIATLLAGRAIEVPVRGLSYGEFLAFHRLEESDESLQRYLRYGGLPHLVDLELTDRVVYEYLGNLYHVILFKDVVARYRIRNFDFLERLVRFLADSVGSLVTAKRISDYLKSQRVRISPNAVLDYLAHLCHACFLAKIHRADVIGRRIFAIGEKYYFEDLGLRHAVKPFVQQDIGKVLENLVYHHLRVCGWQVTTGRLDRREIDFVATRPGETLYVQVAYLLADEATHARELGNLLAIPDNYPKMVVSMDPVIGAGHKGIRHLHIREFLLTAW